MKNLLLFAILVVLIIGFNLWIPAIIVISIFVIGNILVASKYIITKKSDN